jgi:hypothetical protein
MQSANQDRKCLFQRPKSRAYLALVAETEQVESSQNQMSGNPTYQELAADGLANPASRKGSSLGPLFQPL